MNKKCDSRLDCLLSSLKEKNPAKLGFIAVLLLAVIYFLGTGLANKSILSVSAGSNTDKSIENWVNTNPEKIIDSVNNYMQKKRAEDRASQNQKADEYIKKNKDEVLSSKNLPAVNKNGKITVVEFFDYHCGHCRHISKDVSRLAKEFKNVTFVFRDFPIMSAISREMAKVVTLLI